MNEHELWVCKWVEKADSDYQTALIVLQSHQPIADAICFHCQQCVEKYLKAFLLSLGRPVSRTHDLEKLLLECMGIDPSFSRWSEACFLLNNYAVGIRYPDDEDEFQVEQAEEALHLTQ